MIEHKNRCTGLRIPLWNGLQAELWTCPRGEYIPPHRHEHIHSFIVALWGRQRWTVRETTRVVLGPFRRRVSTGALTIAAQSIPAGVRHAATAITFSMFLNLERTTRGVSAATDFVEMP